MPKAGELRTKLVLQREKSSIDEFDEETKRWANIGTLWARIDESSGGERVTGGKKEALTRAQIVSRFRSDTKPTDRLIADDGRHYEIESVTDFSEDRRRWMMIDALRLAGV